jgi:UDP-glucose 4-epimerase
LEVLTRADQVVVIFGLGLIGRAVSEAMKLRGFEGTELPFSWSDETLQTGELRALIDWARGHDNPVAAHIVWSAGDAAFGAEEDAADRAQHIFERTLSTVVRNLREAGFRHCMVHFFSSAGGLFEGQRAVEPTTHPAPRRPYGRLKLRQERFIAGLEMVDGFQIHRLTTVFGFVRPGQRRGLVATLLLNGIRGKITHITGDLTTLRDYTFAPDIADFAARRISSADTGSRSTQLLASGRPASIHEIRRIVELKLGRPSYVQLSGQPANRLDTTFLVERPAGWHPTELSAAISLVMSRFTRT